MLLVVVVTLGCRRYLSKSRRTARMGMAPPIPVSTTAKTAEPEEGWCRPSPSTEQFGTASASMASAATPQDATLTSQSADVDGSAVKAATELHSRI